jgi:2-polyprenyl-3-methyl-5-hydroxy-6-metoxy-1,4-benzoquinol methylase
MEKCKCCGGENLHTLIDFGLQPVAHNLLESEEEEDAIKHLLCLHYCKDCGFVQINKPINPSELYIKYNYCFSAWKRQPHIPDEIEMLSRHIKDKNSRILEIGCNDGVFLEPMQKAGYSNVVGIEANRYAAKEAEAYGFDILNIMFDKYSAAQIKANYGTFEVIVMRQALEHIPDLDGLFEALDRMLGGEKWIFIEVPDFAKALDYGDCSTIWEEHPNYFTSDVLEYLLNRKGYIVIEKAFYNFSGGALSVLAKKAEKMLYPLAHGNREWLKYENFASRVSEYALKLKAALKNMKKKGCGIFLYGTGARACTLVNGLGLAGVDKLIDYAVDDQKEKQGRYMPGSHLLILGLNEVKSIKGEKLFLLAVNQENEKAVYEKILAFLGTEHIKAISLFAPNDILKEVEKIAMQEDK